jgi:SAM-dependent methyltransferase
MNDGGNMVLRMPAPAMRPSEYTSALIQALRTEPDKVRGKQVLEIGSGSGVVLAVLGALGAASVCGIDIEQDAVDAGSRLLAGLGQKNAEFHCGDMWRPVAGRRFDLIVANLPNSPHPQVSISGRPPKWSAGGPDGRQLVDPFIDGLSAHLVPGGRALMTHNSYIGLELSRARAASRGLSFDVRLSILVYVPDEKLALMTPGIVGQRPGGPCTASAPTPLARSTSSSSARLPHEPAASAFAVGIGGPAGDAGSGACRDAGQGPG